MFEKVTRSHTLHHHHRSQASVSARVSNLSRTPSSLTAHNLAEPNSTSRPKTICCCCQQRRGIASNPCSQSCDLRVIERRCGDPEMASGKAQFESGWLLFAQLPRQIEPSLESLGLPRDSQVRSAGEHSDDKLRKAPDQMPQLLCSSSSPFEHYLKAFWTTKIHQQIESANRVSKSK